MGYRELSRMERVEVVRRWQMGESQRAIAGASGMARETVKKYLRTADELGLAANGPPPTEDQVVRLVQVGRVVSTPRTWVSPQAERLELYREQITRPTRRYGPHGADAAGRGGRDGFRAPGPAFEFGDGPSSVDLGPEHHADV